MISSVFVIVALCYVGVTLGGCPTGFKEYKQSCYALVKEAMDWPGAQSACTAMNGYLVEIFSKEENAFVKKMASDSKVQSFWIGGQDLVTEGTWIWPRRGALFTNHFTDWYLNQPDNHNSRLGPENCLEINFRYNGQWNDDACVQRKSFVCERSMYACLGH